MLNSNRTVPRSEIDHLDLSTRVELEASITDAEVAEVDVEELKSRNYSFEQFAGFRLNRGLIEFFGDLHGKTVLDLGCGYSMSPIELALGGATVYACDVSPRAVDAVQRVAEAKGLSDRVTAEVSPAERLAYDDERFDVVFGKSVLHHLDLDGAGREVARVLKPGGRGGFLDPFGHNRVLEFARDYLPYKSKSGAKGTDLPLTLDKVQRFGAHFTSYEWRGHELLSMIGRPLYLNRTAPGRTVENMLRKIDDALLPRVPAVQKYCRYVSIRVTR